MRSREQRKSPEGAHRPQRSFYEMRSWFPRNAQWSPRDEVKRQIGSHETKEYGFPFPKKSAIRLVVSSLYNILYSKFTGKAAGSLAPLELEQTGVESRSIQCESPALPAR